MKTYLVGGAVRDHLLNYPHHENDWVVVGATPDEMIAQGFQPVGKDFPVFLHPQTKEEYALARTERKSGPGHTGFDCYTSPSVTLEQDLQRRDLTINAIAKDQQGEIIDPYHGRQDLEDKILRHVSAAFIEDPLRVLRVARFAARYGHLGFTVAPETIELMRSIVASGELSALPAERLWKETERALAERSPQIFFTILKQCGAIDTLMPAFLTITEHTFLALQRAADTHQPTPVRFALLFIDLDSGATEQLCNTIKAPNEYRHLALLVSRFGHELATTNHSAESLLDLLERTDAFRKPERLDAFLLCGDLLFNEPAKTALIRRALIASKTPNPKLIVDQGFTGKAIATELRKQRLEAIEQIL